MNLFLTILALHSSFAYVAETNFNLKAIYLGFFPRALLVISRASTGSSHDALRSKVGRQLASGSSAGWYRCVFRRAAHRFYGSRIVPLMVLDFLFDGTVLQMMAV
ncbi:hypothetical protein B0H13DRAFT_1855238 [Mycena leptocephala]|nr:hypothetical protein B0H13DRAFT_1855238 [Mycena leptocephala]